MRLSRKPRQNVSSSLCPTSTPRTSREPSAAIPVATTTAIETTWPPLPGLLRTAPSATTRSSTLRVDTPWTEASISTACNAWSIRRRGSRIEGKNEPFRSFGIRSSTSSALVASSFGRVPLRSVTRSSVRSYRCAPITPAASNSTSSCNTRRTHSRIRSTPSPARNASSNSDRADWDKAIGGTPSVRHLVVSHRRSRRWPPTSPDPAAEPQTPPHHGTLLQGRPRSGEFDRGMARNRPVSRETAHANE